MEKGLRQISLHGNPRFYAATRCRGHATTMRAVRFLHLKIRPVEGPMAQ
jgi:hypothetical protein